MTWLNETEARRADPRVLWPNVRSIVMLGMNYGPSVDPMTLLADKGAANISVYARNRDYHDVIKGKLKDLAGWLARQGGDGTQVKVFVDTAPVMEKPLAEAAGLGWQGKHTNLVSRSHGSWLFLGSIFTTLDLEPDAPEPDHCGTCRACLDACPTNAFPAPYQLDARRCISYLTIEHKGTIPEKFRAAIGNRVYGCDDCLAVCPWNKWAQAASEAKLVAREDLQSKDRQLARARRGGLSQPVLGQPRQTARLRPLHAQPADRGRQFRRHRTRPRHAPPPRRSLAARQRNGRLGLGETWLRTHLTGRNFYKPPTPGRATASFSRYIIDMNLFVFGLGYSAQHFIHHYASAFEHVAGTVRDRNKPRPLAGITEILQFSPDHMSPEIDERLGLADVILVSVAARHFRRSGVGALRPTARRDQAPAEDPLSLDDRRLRRQGRRMGR